MVNSGASLTLPSNPRICNANALMAHQTLNPQFTTAIRHLTIPRNHYITTLRVTTQSLVLLSLVTSPAVLLLLVTSSAVLLSRFVSFRVDWELFLLMLSRCLARRILLAMNVLMNFLLLARRVSPCSPSSFLSQKTTNCFETTNLCGHTSFAISGNFSSSSVWRTFAPAATNTYDQVTDETIKILCTNFRHHHVFTTISRLCCSLFLKPPKKFGLNYSFQPSSHLLAGLTVQ